MYEFKWSLSKTHMDPSASLCIAYDSLKQETTVPELTTNDQWFISDKQIVLTPKYISTSIQSSPAPHYCNADRYNILQKVKDAFNNEGFIEELRML